VFKTFNDYFAAGVAAAIFTLWGLHGAGIINLPEIIIGATATLLGLVVQYYFRKSKSETH
jgi:membrane protease YdiL (CAAX protease family)